MVDQTANFVRGEADSSIAAGDTTISVINASEFPDPANGQYNLVLWDDGLGRPDQDSNAEIVRVTGRDTANDNLTVTRAQESTSDVSHPSGSALQLSPTAKTVDDLAVGRFDTIEVFTADGTFDASGVSDVIVEVVGGGGGAGAFDATTERFGTAGGGGGGGYAKSQKDVSSLSSISVTVGGGGAGGTGTANGSAGGDSVFDTPTQVIGNGGNGGAYTQSSQGINTGQSAGGSGGGGQGDLVVNGQDGASGDAISTSISQDVFSIATSEGGDSVYGHGAEQETFVNTISAGIDGSAYGGGGGAGASALGSTFSSSINGGSGAKGVVIVKY